MKKRVKIIIAIVIVVIFASIINNCFFSLQRIEGQELINQSTSPDGRYTVVAYLNNGGATTGWAVLCSVKNNNTGKNKNIYWNYQCADAVIEWVDNDTVIINDVELNVKTDTYDFRNH